MTRCLLHEITHTHHQITPKCRYDKISLFLEIADFVFVELNGQTCVQSSFDNISVFVATELSKSPKYQNMQRPNLPYYIIGILSVVREAF